MSTGGSDDRSRTAGDAEQRDWLRAYAADGSREAFARIVEAHWGMVAAACRRIVRDGHAAEDAAQAAFVVLARKAAGLPRDTDVGSWLYGTAVRSALAMRRGMQRRRRHEALAAAEAPAAASADDGDTELRGRALSELDEALAALATPQRDAIVLRFFRGLSLADAALEAGVPLRTFQTRMHRALDKLRGRLQTRGVSITSFALPALLEQGAGPAGPSALPAGFAQACCGDHDLSHGVADTATGVIRDMAWSAGTRIALAVVAGAVVVAGGMAALAPALFPRPAALATAQPARWRQAPSELAHATDGVRAVAFSPDGRTLASAGSDGTVRLWDPVTRHERSLLRHDGAVTCVVFSPRGDLVASGCFDGSVRLWRADTGALVARCVGHTDQVWSLAWSADGATLASVGDDLVVRLWRAADGSAAGAFTGSGDALRCVAISPDGMRVASGGNDLTVRLWDRERGTQVAAWRHERGIVAMAFSADGDRLAVADRTTAIAIRDVASGRVVSELRGHDAPVTAVAWVDPGTLVSGAEDATVRWWDIATGRATTTLRCSGQVTSVALAPDHRRLAAGSWGRYVDLFDLGE